MNMNEDIQQVIKRDNIAHAVGQLKTKGMLSGSECVVTRCKVKDENSLLKDNVKEADNQVLKLRRELEFFYDKLEKDIDLDPENKSKLLEKAIQAKEVQIQYRIAMELKERINDLESKLQRVTQEYSDYKEDQNRIMTNFQADAKIQEKVKLLNALRDKYDKMLLVYDKLQTEIDRGEVHYKHLAEEHNKLLEEYKLYRSKANQMKTICEKGLRLKPLEDIQPGKIKRRKKLWGIFEIIVRN